jgi:pimeloyl-ACP methyl ester carboxylesterase
MLSLSRLRTLILGCALLVSLIAAGSSRGQGAGSTDVTFKTFDGVTLSGKLYAGGGAGGKKDGTVLLIPSFDLAKGGGMQQQGYDDLAKSLQKEGYTVLSFDFRGFGDSKTVDAVAYWKHPFNQLHRTRKPKVVTGKYPEQIDHKDFKGKYTDYFVNDIAAAKTFLDQENDNKTCNTSNLIVVGAGYGATLGAMWVANECRRRRDLSILPGAAPMLGDLESDSIVGTVWLSISPTLPGRQSVPLKKWIVEGGRTHKIPMAFIYGENDTEGAKIATNMKGAIVDGAAKNDFKFTGSKPISKTKLTGAKLLEPSLDTQSWISDKYLDPAMATRGKKRRTDKKVEASRFFYNFTRNGVLYNKLNKPAGVAVPSVDVSLLIP